MWDVGRGTRARCDARTEPSFIAMQQYAIHTHTIHQEYIFLCIIILRERKFTMGAAVKANNEQNTPGKFEKIKKLIKVNLNLINLIYKHIL